jgi:hypothetical protein
LQLVRKFRLPALFCALAVLLCELIARPYANMSVCDDGPYILMAHTLATTGHFVYNGWAAPMIGWQLYLGAAFIKVFGFSFTAVRFSTVLVATVMAFVIQRTLVHAGITERNATLGTLAFVLSPLYLMMSVTYMTDIFGLFAIVICLYGCLHALQSPTQHSTLLWLVFAIATNALCGTARQIAWLGILILVPSTLWLLRAQRRVLIIGAIANLAGILFMIACLKWLKHQPYVIPEHLLPDTFPIDHVLGQLTFLFLEAPFLILPIVALFLPEIRKTPLPVFIGLALLLLGYLVIGWYPSHLRGAFLVEPTIGWEAGWVGIHGIFEGASLGGMPPLFLSRGAQVLMTVASFGGVTGLFAALFIRHPQTSTTTASSALSWKQLATLLAPVVLVYILLLIPRATGWVFDRYLLPLLVVALLCLVRFYQDRISPRLPLAAGALLVGITAIYGIAVTHNLFSLYRARVALAAELNAHGVPDISVDNGWEYNLDVELQHAPSINFPTIAVPANAYVPIQLTAGACPMHFYEYTPHIHPLYGVSFDPNTCYRAAPFSPVHYSRWLAAGPGVLYVVRYIPYSKP